REELKTLAIETALHQARGAQDHAEIARLALERSKFLLQKHEKLSAMEEALQSAQVLKDKKLVESYRQRIELLSPSRIEKPAHTQYLTVARDFQDERNFPKALHYYWKALRHKKSGH